MFHLVSTKNCNLWADPTLDVDNLLTSYQMWQIWLAENTKRALCIYLKNQVQSEVVILCADLKEHGRWGMLLVIWFDLAFTWCFCVKKGLNFEKVQEVLNCIIIYSIWLYIWNLTVVVNIGAGVTFCLYNFQYSDANSWLYQDQCRILQLVSHM